MDPLIAEAFVYGDRRKYLTALLILDEEQLAAWAAESGLADRDYAQLVASPEVRALVDARLAAVNRGFARFETIKKYRLLDRPFSIETGELTPTLKVKRKVIAARYGQMLNSLYEE